MPPFSARSSTISVGSPDAPRRVIIFHGYTGSPDEFRMLAETIAVRLDAYVTVPLLPGHGTEENDLLAFGFEDFLTFARTHLHEAQESGKPFALIGHCFGGHLAGILAPEFKPAAIVFTIVPYQLRFPFSLKITAWLMSLRKFWNKRLAVNEKIARIGIFLYRDMPGIGLNLVREGNRRLAKALPHIVAPILAIQTHDDPLARPSSGMAMITCKRDNAHDKALVLTGRKHSIFFGKGWEVAVEDIVDFLEEEMLPSRN